MTYSLSERRPLKLICLGDSLTGPSPIGAFYLDKYLKWSNLLQFGLDAILGPGGAVVLNQGKAGEISGGALADLNARVLRHRPDIVIVLLGANNFAPIRANEATESDFRADMLEIVQRLKAAGIRVLLLTYPDPRADSMDKVWTHANSGNRAVEQVAAHEGVELLPLKPAFDAAVSEKGLPPAALASPVDGIHLNPGGELVLAGAVLEKLRALGWVS
ncbi:MAG TPA: SGNH/GDSL hydrolase family protein [Candidatus Methylacidiphilales bacterium]|nr:SGNH/GDSL hydrolase family protein [Candidatus Methylacidiphilales bacterium]